jgi:hypothetical protein
MTTAQFEKLVNQIMEDAEKDGEPVTREEALEMARMEVNANKDRRYEKADGAIKEKKKRTVKKDPEKIKIISDLAEWLTSKGYDANITNDTREVTFGNFSLTLIKHRPPKK